MKRTFAALAVLAAAAAASFAMTPDSADAAARWRLDFAQGDFEHVVVGPKKRGMGAVHYYLPYTITNNSSETIKPLLHISVRTETGKNISDHFDAQAYKAIAKAEKKTKVASTFQLLSKALKPGESADAVAHFGRMDDHADILDVRVSGLWNPVFRDKHGKTHKETRILELHYKRRGDEYSRYRDEIRFTGRTEAVDKGPEELVHPAKRQ